GPRNPSRSKKRLLKTALRDNYLEKRRPVQALPSQVPNPPFRAASLRPKAIVPSDRLGEFS
ncbi:hypothetical protein, partial [Aeromonas veronii]|uniref:hypothetical protein n=1 Tax=Aeromonas veronii TaxID=654 RepID=UPI001FD5DD49